MKIQIVKSDEKYTVDAKDFAIVLTPKVYSTMQSYVDECKIEVSLMGTVVRDGFTFVVKDVYFMKQKGTKSSSEYDQDAMASLSASLEDPSQLRFSFHSHNDMDAFYSGDDKKSISSMISLFGDYLVSIVANKKGKMLGRIDFVQDISVSVEGVAIYLQTEDSIIDVDEVKRNVKSVEDEYNTPSPIERANLWGKAGNPYQRMLGNVDDRKSDGVVHECAYCTSTKKVKWNGYFGCWLCRKCAKEMSVDLKGVGGDRECKSSFLNCDICHKSGTLTYDGPSEMMLCDECLREIREGIGNVQS